MAALVQPQPVHVETAAEINTLLGRGAEFEGKLTFEGTVRIDGRLRGEVFSEDTLVIGEGAEVHAEIHVGVVIIEGTVNGNIRAERSIELHAPARVRGNIQTPSLFIDKGVIFEGSCKMESEAAALAEKAQRPRVEGVPSQPPGPPPS